MVLFNETDQKKKLATFRKKEEEYLAQQKAAQSDYSYVDLTGISIDTDALLLVDEETARAANMAVFGRVDKRLQIAAHEPDADGVQSIVYQLQKSGYETQIFVASSTSLQKAFGYYADVSKAERSDAGKVSFSENAASALLESNPSRKEAIDFITETLETSKDTTEMVEAVVAAAIAMKASDIHIEAGEKERAIRMRIDGVLQKIHSIPERTYNLLLSRIKLLSGMKLNIKDEAQDGRFSIRVEGNDTEVRSSVVPSTYGEAIVMRVLSKSALDITMENLGMQPHFLRLIRHEINRPKGLVLNTGPTGSGKTTTLYSFLKEVNQPGVKTITIENPVEYHLDGIVQTQVDPDDDYTFHDGLKAAMRQDPDIIMVGEIRDTDTAKTAVQASLTGHRVLSTLHTNDAAGTFPRLVELGIKENLLGQSVNVVMAQRLVRTLCDNCKQEIKINEENKPLINALTKDIPNPDEYEDALSATSMYKAVGCSECNDTGYRGRIGVFEAIVVDDVISQLVQENPSDPKIREHTSKKQQLLTMAQDGIIKVLRGITDISELRRVVDLDDSIDDLVL
ncbi:MAG: ATPase, T2SS/T4P/T4SS family [Candidatus Paceibacterota bacterium]